MLYFFQNKRAHEQTTSYIEKQTDYTYLTQIGEGSYGVAYLLEQDATKQRAVLKRLKPKHHHRRGRARFEQEMQFLQQLQSLPVPQMMTAGTIEKSPFYIMSYVDGETFEQAIFERQAVFSLADTLHYTKMLLEILQQLHAKGIVHRDLRIPNIMLKNGQLTILDFGLATMIDPHFSVAHLKNPKKATHPMSDLYAIGHFMLFLLYSTYEPTTKKSTSWQQELALPNAVKAFIERLLTIQQPFLSCEEALVELVRLSK